MIAHHPPGSFGIVYKVQFQFFMVMQGKIKVRLYPGEDGKTITGSQRGNFPENILMHGRPLR